MRILIRRSQAQGDLKLHEPHSAASEDRRLCRVCFSVIGSRDIFPQLSLCHSINSADYAAQFPEALREIGKWISEGRIIRKYHIVEGLESAPESLPLLFTGGNTGKLLVP